MPRTECPPGDFMVIRSRTAKVANAPNASVMQKAVWAQFADASIGIETHGDLGMRLLHRHMRQQRRAGFLVGTMPHLGIDPLGGLVGQVARDHIKPMNGEVIQN